MNFKNKKWWIKFKNGKLRLAILAIVSLVAGASLLIDSKNSNEWIIRGIGFIWVIDGISYVSDLIIKIFKKNSSD